MRVIEFPMTASTANKETTMTKRDRNNELTKEYLGKTIFRHGYFYKVIGMGFDKDSITVTLQPTESKNAELLSPDFLGGKRVDYTV